MSGPFRALAALSPRSRNRKHSTYCRFRSSSASNFTFSTIQPCPLRAGRLFLSAWVELAVNRLKALAVHVRVMLRCANVGVTEQFLNGPQVRTASQEMSGETVSQRVR